MSKPSTPLDRAMTAVRGLRARLESIESRAHGPVAILGMSTRLPGGANSPEALWTILEEGRDVTREVPADRWDVDAFFDPDPATPGRMHVRRGGFLSEPIHRMDAAFFGISPREAANMDPLQRLLLEMSWEALERAGIPPHRLEGTRSAVYLGLSPSGFETRVARRYSYRQVSGYAGTGAANSVAAGRISFVLGLQGPNIAVDTACSSSLVAMVLGMQSLREGQSDLALVGGLNLLLAPDSSVFLSKVGALSADGRCRTFDDSATGYGRGEGGGVFVMKRLSDALAANDPIIGVLRGGAVNHDGRSSGLTVPNAEAQRAVIEAALADAGLKPADIDYVDAHGTGTPLGDPIELRVLGKVYGRGRAPDAPLVVGSVKTNVGHPEPGSGSAGVAKALLAMAHGWVPAHLHFERPTAHVDWDSLPLRVPAEGMKWPDRGRSRRAGVSSFGLSGTNAHVIVESAPERSEPLVTEGRTRRLVAISGASPTAVRTLSSAYRERLVDGGVSLEDLEATTLAGRGPLAWRVAVQGEFLNEVASELERVASGEIAPIQAPSDGDPRVAFLFTGQGAQYPGMAVPLLRTSRVFAEAIEACDGVLRPALGASVESLLSEQDTGRIHRTAFTQPLLFAVEWGLANLWRSWGVHPAFVLGHSLGEYVAATVAGALGLDDALRLVVERGRLMEELPEGGRMAVLFATEERVAAALKGRETEVSIATINGPDNVVLSGVGAAVEEVVAFLSADGVAHTWLTVSHAFHSPLMEPMLASFREAVAATPLSDPTIPLISNLTGRPLARGQAVDPEHWVNHVRQPVRFWDSVQYLVDQGVTTFLEVGPHPALSGMVRTAHSDPGIATIPSLRRGREPWTQLLESLATLRAVGGPTDWDAFVAESGGRRVALPTYPFEREEHRVEPEIDFQPDGFGAMSRRNVVHPILGAPVSSPAIRGWVFENTVSLRTPPYLADHGVEGFRVFPGAGYVELSLAAARLGPGWDDASVEQVTFERALVLPTEGTIDIQVIVDSPEEGRAPVRVVANRSDRHESAVWLTVFTGQLCRTPSDGVGSVDAGAVEGSDREFDIPDLYVEFTEKGLDYGPSFRVLRALRVNGSTATGQIALANPEIRSLEGYGIHPALLDAAFQAFGALGSHIDPMYADRALLPFALDSAWFKPVVGPSVEVRATLRGSESEERNGFIGDIWLLAPDGTVVGEIHGFRARRSRGRIGKEETAAVGQGVLWVGTSATGPAGPEAGDWIVVDDGSDLLEGVTARIVAAGGHVYTAGRGGVGDALTPAMKNGRLRGVVYLATSVVEADGGAPAASITDALLDLGVLAQRGPKVEGMDLILVTRGAVGPGGAEHLGVLPAAALTGALGVLRVEHPEIRSRAIDLDPVGETPGTDPVEQIFADAGDVQIAAREGQLWAPRLAHLKDDSTLHGIPAAVAAENYRMEIARRGSLEAISYAKAPRRSPDAGEIEVRVVATGLNFRDVLNVLGQYPGDPGDPGVEFTGVITRVGAGVADLVPGLPVMGMSTGLFAGYATLPAEAVVELPAGVDFDAAASIPVTFLTAEWGLLRLGRLAAGERVLIHAGAGGVGQAALQVARAVGAEVFVTASAPKWEFLRNQGVEHIYDSRSPSFYDEILADTGGEGVDVVLNSLTGELLQHSINLLRPGGRFIELGRMELYEPEAFAAQYPGREYSLVDFSIVPNAGAEIAGVFQDIKKRFDEGLYAALRTRVFPAESVTEAFRFMAQARHLGKVVVRSARLAPEPVVRKDGAYVVTGATGGIGAALVEWLVDQGAGAVVASARSAPSGDTEARFAALRGRGADVRFEAADVSDEGDAARLIEAARATPHDIRGVFHAAGVLDDRMMANLTPEAIQRVLAPKVTAALHLHAATAGDDLDHFVLFSSVAALLGGTGQGAYAGANAALAALAEVRHRKGRAALCLDWGPWGEVGMAARLADTQKRMMEARGMGFLDPDNAFERMGRMLGGGSVRVMVADVDWALLGDTTGARTAPILEEIVRALPSASNAADGEALRVMDPEARRGAILEWLTESLSSVLGQRPERIEPETVIGTLGFDSLMAVELRNRIESRLGFVLPAPRLLDCRTVNDIAEAMELSLDLSPVVEAGAAEGDPDDVEEF